MQRLQRGVAQFTLLPLGQGWSIPKTDAFDGSRRFGGFPDQSQAGNNSQLVKER
jgi:hypothetical protein